MKKYMPGFVPVDYKKAGRVLMVIGLGCVLVRSVSYLTNWYIISNYLLYFGLGAMLIGGYIVYASLKEEL
jgi:hypothetical protein